MQQVFKVGLASAIAAGFVVAGAQAHAEFYAGAAIGESTLETSDNLDGQDLDYESSDTAMKVFGGYMFNDYFGAEVSYIDMGALDDEFGFDGGEAGDVVVALDADVTGFAGQLVAQYPIGPVDVFAKAGMMMYDIDGDITASSEFGDRERESVSDDGNELFWGLGGRYNFGQLAARIEYEVLDADGIDDAYLWSVGIEYSFGM